MTLKLNGSSSGYTAIDAPAAAGSNTLVLPTTNGSAGQVLQTDGNGNLTWVTPTVYQPSIIVDRYRYVTDTANSDQLLTSWERNTEGNANRLPGNLGTGVTHSSGTFSFPSTGIWEVKLFTNFLIDGNEYIAQLIIKTASDGTNYNNVAFARNGDRNSGVGSVNVTCSCSAMLDITNTTNHKVQIHTDSFGVTTLKGDDNMDLTALTFIRWGDT